MIPEKKKANGFVYFFEKDSSLPLVYLYIDILCGSELDPEGKSGAMRLAAQMLKMGTKKKSREELAELIERMGADFEIAVTHHVISISAHVLSSSFDKFVELLEEVLSETSFSPDRFSQLQRETVAKIVQSREDDKLLAYRNFRQILFPSHPYGRRSMGRRKQIESVTVDEVFSLFNSKIRKAPIVFGGAGDIDEDRFVKKLLQALKGFSDCSCLPSDVPSPRQPEGVVIRLVDKPARTQSQIYMGHLAPRARDSAYFAFLVLNTAFGGTFTARLSEEVRRKRGLSYGAYSRMLRSRQNEAFYLWTFPSIEDTAICVELQVRLLQLLRDKAIKKEEFDFAVRYLRNHFLFAVETAPMRVSLAMKELYQDLPSGFFNGYRDSVERVRFDEVQEVSKHWINPDSLRISILCTADRVHSDIEKQMNWLTPRIEVSRFDDD